MDIPRDLNVGALSHGAHAALLYSSRAEQTDVLETFVGAALRANDRLLYVGDREYGDHAMKAYGAASERAIASGQFVIENSADTYMAGGYFDARRMLQHYSAAMDHALADGYSGLRVAADMGWSARALNTQDRLVRYEQILDRALGSRPAVVLCQYDRRLFDEEALEALAAAHAHAARPDPLHNAAHVRIERMYDPSGIRVFGDIDVSSRLAFRDALLRVAPSAEGRMVIDLRGVKYLDAAGVGAIVAAAQHANHSSVEIRVSPSVRRIFEMLQPTLPRVLHVEEAQ